MTKALESQIESLHRKLDAARHEAEKADDEALHWKTIAAKTKMDDIKDIYATMWEWKRRAEAAEAALDALSLPAVEAGGRIEAAAMYAWAAYRRVRLRIWQQWHELTPDEKEPWVRVARAAFTTIEGDTYYGWIYLNPDAGTEWARNHPIKSGECHDAESVRPGTLRNLHEQMTSAWRALTESEASHGDKLPTEVLQNAVWAGIKTYMKETHEDHGSHVFALGEAVKSAEAELALAPSSVKQEHPA